MKSYNYLKSIFVFTYFFLFSLSPIMASLPYLKRTEPQQCRISIAIPCSHKHIQHLIELLQYYIQQTERPDEIVISLSGININDTIINEIENFPYPFTVKIITASERVSAGGNRNIAMQHCSGDVIVFQDADDVPHPQRVEIIKYCFQTYEVDHLTHLYCLSEFPQPDDPFEQLSLENMEFLHFSSYLALKLHDWKMVCRGSFTNGNIAISREIARNFKWDLSFRDGEDVYYNAMLYSLPIKTLTVKASLLLYRNYLSSFYP